MDCVEYGTGRYGLCGATHAEITLDHFGTRLEK